MIKSQSIVNSYTKSHAKYHDSFNTILKKFSLYDIFLVDMKGNIIYSTFKEKDYATNIKTGVYSNSGIAKVNEKAYEIKQGEVAFCDFKPYEPSYNTPASFIATPVFKQGVRLGNLIMQFPIDSIDAIMSFNGKYKEAGLGQTGKTSLIGSDYKMRNNHRFIDKITNKDVESSGTTIAMYEIKNEAIKEALSNKSGIQKLFDQNGVEILIAYTGFKLFDEQWAIIAQIDDAEALKPIITLNMILILISLVILILLSFLGVILLKKSVIKPLINFEEGLNCFFKYLNNESQEIVYLDDSKGDEIGKMSKVLNENITRTKKGLEYDRKLINDAVKVLSKFQNGDLAQRINATTTNPSLNELKDVLNEMGKHLENNIEDILNVLKQYIAYDYTKKTSSKGLTKQLEQLANGVNSLGSSITKMLIENKTNGLKLAKSSNVLLNSVGTLSSNANSAAASIEETSAAIEQINANIASSNTNVQKMSDYAQEVISSVKTGEELALKTTSSMDEINQQVSDINEAITVIDQIAFQTNILSLNAAVEAATAGEAGKGFAVVAQEVRNLASRSAEAAKQIKDMVENANIKANEGKNIADKMTTGYAKLSENISNTIDLIEAVSISSKEQQEGVSQINETVAKLDRQTQENASIAQNTNNVAHETDKISKAIVKDTDEKKFEGKDSINI